MSIIHDPSQPRVVSGDLLTNLLLILKGEGRSKVILWV